MLEEADVLVPKQWVEFWFDLPESVSLNGPDYYCLLWYVLLRLLRGHGQVAFDFQMLVIGLVSIALLST